LKIKGGGIKANSKEIPIRCGPGNPNTEFINLWHKRKPQRMRSFAAGLKNLQACAAFAGASMVTHNNKLGMQDTAKQDLIPGAVQLFCNYSRHMPYKGSHTVTARPRIGTPAKQTNQQTILIYRWFTDKYANIFGVFMCFGFS